MNLAASPRENGIENDGRKDADAHLARILNPRLTFRVGITGHRPNKIGEDQLKEISGMAKAILEAISGAAERIFSETRGVFAGDRPNLRLTTSLAEGADTIFARAARECGYRLDVILPFRKETYAKAQGFSDEAGRIFEDLLANPAPHSLLELDNDAHRPENANAAYLEAGRLMLAHSDILIAVWNGMREEGVGGTAQIVREAREAGVPVIWIKPDGALFLMVPAEQALAGGRAISIATKEGEPSDELVELVSIMIAPPHSDSDPGKKGDPDARKRLERFLAEKERSNSRWCAYDAMRCFFIGRKFKTKVEYAIDSETEKSWDRFGRCAEKIGGDEFASDLKRNLESKWRRADNIALHYSHVYRSAYIINYVLASVAIVVGLFSVFFWGAEYSIFIKGGCVAVEVGLIGLILFLTKKGDPRKGDWHRRWLEARSVAELLRSARLLVLVAQTAAPRIDFGHRNDTWVEWYVRSVLREIGPPAGVLDESALRDALSSAIEDEVAGQVDYNDKSRDAYQKMDHKLHAWGETLFWLTLITGCFYIAISALYWVFHDRMNSSEWGALKDFVKALATFLGAGLPAVGAALFGIHATGDFRLAGERAALTSSALQQLRRRLGTEMRAPKRERATQLLLMLTQILTSDLREWAKIYRMRGLTLPG